ncbi:MOSC domain-containing protein [Candidatus Kaiserbacteria bacterium]|nr:MOSC domain-containing protein [Candidatus Kaiserbacteria bacterium]
MVGKLLGIATKPTKRAGMELHESRIITFNGGLEGDHRGRGGLNRERQVTLLSVESWAEACKELGAALDWTARRANILIEGIAFNPTILNKWINFGDNVVLEVTGETKPCKRMDEVHFGLQNALRNWRGGVCCRVIQGGFVRVGTNVEILTFE